MSLIIGLGAAWIAGGGEMQIHFDWQSIKPHWTDKSLWVSLTAVMMSFCGIEIATVHANDVPNPQSAFPRALAYSVIIILSTLMFGSLAIAVVLPHNDINLVAGIMQAFDAFFARYHASWFMPVIAVMLVLGGLGGVNNWIIAPTKGLLVAAQDGNMPKRCQKTNAHGAPVFMLVLQAFFVTFLSALFLFMPSVNSSYWLLTALAAQLYMLMYLLMFFAAIKLRKTAPDHPRAFKIPGGFAGLLLVAGIGIIGTVATIIVSFLPPDNIGIGSTVKYELTLLCGLGIMLLPPFIMGIKKYPTLVEQGTHNNCSQS